MRTILKLLVFLLFFSTSQAQFYFGQNKVQYTRFDWQVLSTEHFKILPVTRVLERMPKICRRSAAFSNSESDMDFGCSETAYFRCLNCSLALGWIFSKSRTLTVSLFPGIGANLYVKTSEVNGKIARAPGLLGRGPRPLFGQAFPQEEGRIFSRKVGVPLPVPIPAGS